ncbi:MAG TPA: hypothetical protein VMT85_15910 [Thermoanaerobaculia bacterium]|nr:hypothetical protein [Thermoanaerobaculia bacterium]
MTPTLEPPRGETISPVPASAETAPWPRGWLLLILALLSVAAWAAAPAILRHLAHEEPLLHETVRLEDPSPAGARAYRADLEPSPQTDRWASGWTRVLEDGRELERVPSGREVRERGAGTYTVVSRPGAPGVSELFVLFGSSDDSDPRTNGRRYRVVRPRELAPALAKALVVLFLGLNLATLVLITLGLKRHDVLPAAGPIALSVVAGVAVLALLERRLPESTGDLLGEKLRQYARVAGEIDTIFLGSSRVYRHLDPATFDATFAEYGRRASSFNLGVPDMRILETLHLAERLLEGSSAIERLIVEAEAEPLFIREENRETQRVRRWHGIGTLRRAIPAILDAGAPWPETALAVLDRLALFAWRASQIGRGLDGIDALLDEVGDRPARWIEPENRGFLSLDADRRAPRTESDREGLERRWRELHEEVADWRRTVARLRRSSPEGELRDPYELERFAELERLAARHDVELVFVLSPRPERRPNLVHAAEAGIIDRLARFDDPDRYPEFYALDGRYDRHHLDEEAAKEMTRRLALALLGERDGPRPESPGAGQRPAAARP